ncbi:dihydroorotate dehydrogenase [Aquipuribacter hungaricus]|uniref:Dihydroorotate dehydrogenase n=1 Tax=Aquipuribacter hungaricus TaxID=545624 RepID=A0ABV7WFP8_9MICO
MSAPAAASVGGATAPDPAAAVDMSVRLTAPAGTVDLAAGVLTASGCAAAGRELDPYLDLTTLGGVVTKTIMRGARSGRPTPRMAETPSGMLNSIGLQGPGIAHFLAHDLPWVAERGARAVVSVAGEDVEEFVDIARTLRAATSDDGPLGRPGTDGGVLAAVEVNISCPNVANRGLVFACDPGSAAEVVAAVRAATDPRVPVLAKLSPDVTDIVAIARSVLAAGADGLVMVNTLLGVAIDVDRGAPVLSRVTGGLSGPAIRPVAVRCVWQVTAAMRAGLLPTVPVVGVGGVRTGRDAAELVLAGASAVQVGTVTFGDPGAPARVRDELAAVVRHHGLGSLAGLVGRAHDAVRDGGHP